MVHATAFADTLTWREQYADWNSSYDTFRIRPNDYSISVHELFNIAAEQYTDGQSVATYNNAADFYAERGVKSLVSDWTVSEGSQIIGMSRSAVIAHSVNLTNSTGTVWNPITVSGGRKDDVTREFWIESLDGSRNIDVGAIGAVNMNFDAWVGGNDGGFKTIYGDQPELNDGVIQMVAFDVTDLLKAMGYADIGSAFMFGWEDLNWATQGGKDTIDFDYNDMVYIMTNVTPNTATPEPATMLIFGLGITGVAAARRMKRK